MKIEPRQVCGGPAFSLWEGMTKDLKETLQKPGVGLTVTGEDYDTYEVQPLEDRRMLSRPAFWDQVKEVLQMIHADRDPEEQKIRQYFRYLSHQIPYGIYADSFDLQMAVDTFLACSRMLHPDRNTLLAFSGTTLTFWS